MQNCGDERPNPFLWRISLWLHIDREAPFAITSFFPIKLHLVSSLRAGKYLGLEASNVGVRLLTATLFYPRPRRRGDREAPFTHIPFKSMKPHRVPLSAQENILKT